MIMWLIINGHIHLSLPASGYGEADLDLDL